MSSYLFCVLLLASSSCQLASSASSPKDPEYTRSEPSNVGSEVDESVDLTPADKVVIYSSALRILHAELVNRNILSAVGEDHFVYYRRSTIPPKEVERLDSASKASPTLRRNFVRSNQVREELDEYPLKQPVVPLVDSSDQGLEDFYKLAKTSDRRTRAVFALSSVGVDHQSSSAVVYVEVFSEIAKQESFYLVLKMSRVAPGYYTGTFNGVDSFDLIALK